MFDEQILIKNIFSGMDWQEVLEEIVVSEGMDPWEVDIIKLTDTFMKYLQTIQKFDFKIPGRFILIAAILLRMKCEILFEEEEEKKQQKDIVPPIDISQIPELTPPMERITSRKVSLKELIDALNKAFEFKEHKESRLYRIRHAAMDLIEEPEDVETKIEKIYRKIVSRGNLIKFSELVPDWKRKEIVSIFIPILHLEMRGNIQCEQEDMFKEIYIKIK